MLHILLKLLVIIALFSTGNLIAQTSDQLEDGDDACANLIDKLCNDQEQNIYDLWQEMLDQNFNLQVIDVKKISQEILVKCENVEASRDLCALVSIEALLKENKGRSQEKRDHTLAMLLDQDLLAQSLDHSIYLSLEYFRLLNMHVLEAEKIEKFGQDILSKAVASNLATKDPWAFGEIYYGLGKFQENLKEDTEEAKKLYYQALRYFQIAEDIESILVTYYEISSIQFLEGDLKSSRLTILEALSISIEEEDHDDIRLELLSLLGNIEGNLNSGREALIGKQLLDIYQDAFIKGRWNLIYDANFAWDIEKYIYHFDCNKINEVSELFDKVMTFMDTQYGVSPNYLNRKHDLQTTYFEIDYKKWICLDYEDDVEKFDQETIKLLQRIERVIEGKEFAASYWDSPVLTSDLYDYFWGFDNAIDFADYSPNYFYKKITSISERWLDEIIAEDLNVHQDAGFKLLAIIANAVRATNDPDDSAIFSRKLLNFLEVFSSQELFQNAPGGHAYDKLFFASTAMLYEYGYKELAEEIYRKYFLSLKLGTDDSFSEIVKATNHYEEINFIMSADILIDEDVHQIRSMDSDEYEVRLLNQNLRSRMHLRRSKYEVLELKDYFKDQNIRELIQAYVNSNTEIKKANTKNNFLDDQNIEGYLDLAQKSKDLSAAQKKLLVNKFFPDVNFLEYQELLHDDETLIIQTVVSVDYSIYFYSLMISDDDYMISRVNLADYIEGYVDDDQPIWLLDPKQNMVFIWSKYIEGIKNNYFNNSDITDIGIALSDIHLHEIDEFIEDKNKLIFINDFNAIFSPDLLIFEEEYLIKTFEVSQYISLFDFLERNKKPLQYKNYFGFAAQEFNPIFQVDPLQNTVNEVENSSQFFTNKINYINKEFSKELLQKNQYQNSVLHFSTHNVLVENELFGKVPALITGDKTNGGYLDIINISNLQLEGSFILLAACNTTQIIEDDPDAFSGLVKSFKLAGAEKIFATRWEIETLSSEQFIVSFLGKVEDGLEPNSALAMTKREFIDSAENSHPIFWGAFTLVN